MNKTLRWLFAVSAFCMLLQGCSSKSKEYERDTTPGETIKITLSEMDTMIVQGKTFAVMLTQSMCGYCQEFHETLSAYQKDHHLIMYEVVLDEEQATREENLAIINRHINDFSTTPGIFYLEDGKQKGHLQANAQGITEELLDEWVREYQLDHKE